MGRAKTTWILALMLVACLPGAARGAFADTDVERYSPWKADGSAAQGLRVERQRGECFTTSFAAPRTDTWRCLAVEIEDPCFESPTQPDTVLCVDSPWSRRAVLLRTVLDRADHPELRLQIWALEIANGRKCSFLTGATAVFKGKRANYGCGDPGRRGTLWGRPRRKEGSLWSWFSPGYSPQRLRLVRAVRAWR